jgi:hypothetical protein
MEDAIHKCVWEHFELPQPTEEEWRTVKHYDDFMLGNEAPQLMLNPDEFQDIEIVYDGVQIPRFGNVHVENRFLEILEFLLKEYKEETK